MHQKSKNFLTNSTGAIVTSLQLQNGLQKGPTTKCIYSVKCEKQLSNLLTIFSLVFCEKETAAAEEGISRGLYYHLLWATCVFKRQCGGAEKLECLQNAKDHNSESTNSERLLKRGKFQSHFGNGQNYFFLSLGKKCFNIGPSWDMVSIQRCHVLYDSIRPLALLISSHVSCKRPSFVRKSNKRRGKAKREKKM